MISVAWRTISPWVEQFFQHQSSLALQHLLSFFAVIFIRYCYFWTPITRVPSSRWPFYFVHNTGRWRRRSWKIIAFGRYTLLYWTFFSIYLVDVNLITNIYFLSFFQVRLGTERGAEVVKAAVLSLYALLVAFGLSKALPLTCIVSTLWISYLFSSFLRKYSCYLDPALMI